LEAITWPFDPSNDRDASKDQKWFGFIKVMDGTVTISQYIQFNIITCVFLALQRISKQWRTYLWTPGSLDFLILDTYVCSLIDWIEFGN
jgi:hypothetical protein